MTFSLFTLLYSIRRPKHISRLFYADAAAAVINLVAKDSLGSRLEHSLTLDDDTRNACVYTNATTTTMIT